MRATRPTRVLIAGCGDLGIRCAAALPGATIFGLRRDVSVLPPSIQPIAADLQSGVGFAALPEAVDTLIYAPTPGQRSPAAYRAIYIDALARLLDALPQPSPALRLIFVSSTAVYGQNAGEIVDENSPCVPTEFNGQILLQAEELARTRVADTLIVRLAGLYGPGRLWLLRRVRAAEPIALGETWSNRFHIDDAAQLLALLSSQARVPPLIVGCDNEPSTEAQVLDWIASAQNLPLLPRSGAFRISGKRVCNDLSRSLGWRPRYASYRDGYTSELFGES